MALNTYPPSGVGSPIKTIQRGVAVSAGTITISSVDTNKSFLHSYSSGSAGSVGITGSNSGTLNPSGSTRGLADTGFNSFGNFPSFSGTRTLAAGATSLTSAEFGVYFTNSTTITATGACNWEVMEYN
jgi:hypothetical protein